MDYLVIGVIKSGEEAIEKASQNHPDLVLMDIMLKGNIDGIEAADIIYEYHGIPSILITAYSLTEFKQRYRLQGIVDPIQKPIQEDELRERVESVLKLKTDLKKNKGHP